ncbi:hypothetical protein [Nocardioides sp.]|uniref:VG15 protein n=1 Tax=Nocardioides sp. TaxID=35761 RepID=UPI0035195CCA
MAQPQSASRYRTASLAVALQAVRQAFAARPRGSSAVATTVATYQAAQAVLAERSVTAILTEQGIDVTPASTLIATSFTTELARLTTEFEKSIEQQWTDYQFQRLTESLVQDAGRAAQSVAIATRPRVAWVRHLTLPSCSRCAVLAGRVYRYSEGFQRHPGCDCVMVPTTVGGVEPYDLETLVREDKVSGLSKADRRAIADGADLGRVVNVRRSSAGISESGRVLYRRDRMTPEAIYRQTGDDREAALALLQRNGYIR